VAEGEYECFIKSVVASKLQTLIDFRKNIHRDRPCRKLILDGRFLAALSDRLEPKAINYNNKSN
jgi:hypothetical protein